MRTKKALVAASASALLLAGGIGTTAHALLDDNNSNACGQAGTANCSSNSSATNNNQGDNDVDVDGGGGNQGNGGIVSRSNSKTGGTSAKVSHDSTQKTNTQTKVKGGGNIKLSLH